MKYFILILLPLLLSANLRYNSNYAKEVAILESFDIEGSFLYDAVLNKMKNNNATVYKEKHFFDAMNEGYLFIPAIKNILSENGIPPEFLFLAMAESDFSNKAYSKKRASGLWQFMPATAKLYGLKIDNYVDERRDFIKSTNAAAKYLSHLHDRFGKWYLAAIAYNCGGGRLSQGIKRAKSDELTVLLDPKKQYIPRESRLYIRRILALAMMGNDEQLLLKSEYEHILNRANAYSVSEVSVPPGESLKRVSQLVGIPIEKLHKLNRHLKYDFLPPYKKNHNIYIPYIKLSEFKQKYYQEQIRNIYKVHVVKNRDNLSSIGRTYGVPYKVIMDFNNLKYSKLMLNQKLIIPIEDKANSEKIDSTFYYMVQEGDTLASISKAYRVSIENLMLQNNLDGSIIKTGERLKVNE